MSLFYCCIHFINSSVDRSCRNSPMPLNRRMQSTYPWQYAFCPSSEFISSSLAIHSRSNFLCSWGSCCIVASHFLSLNPCIVRESSNIVKKDTAKCYSSAFGFTVTESGSLEVCRWQRTGFLQPQLYHTDFAVNAKSWAKLLPPNYIIFFHRGFTGKHTSVTISSTDCSVSGDTWYMLKRSPSSL